jgi:hypothetical protein
LPLLEIANALEVPLPTVVLVAFVYDQTGGQLSPATVAAIIEEINGRLSDEGENGECGTG